MASLPQHSHIHTESTSSVATAPTATTSTKMPLVHEESTPKSGEGGGGRLWKLAGEEAQHQQQQEQQVGRTNSNQIINSNSNNNKWAETFKARTRSCAEPNATTSTTNTTATTTTTTTAMNANPDITSTMNLPPPDVVAVTVPTDQLVFPNRDVLPVAQLLILGMVGILVGWLGNTVVGTSCHFASIDVSVGQKEIALHFGLYKYSTVESGLNG